MFCGPPDDIINGYLVSVSGPYSGDTATYACETGFQLSSSTPIKCRNTGSWDTLPICFCESSSLSTHIKSLFFCMVSVCDAYTPRTEQQGQFGSSRICMMKWGNSNWLYFMAECFEERDNACITIFAALLFLSTLTVSVLCSLAHIRCKHFISTLLYCITIRMLHDFSSVYFS